MGDSLLPFAIVAVVITLIVMGAIIAHRAAQARRDALLAFATARGWTFSPSRDHGHDDQFRQFKNFRQGSGRYAYNSVFGSIDLAGRPCRVKTGDYHYETHSTNSKGQSTTHHHHFSYLLAEVPLPGVPELAIRPEGMFDKLGAFFGFDDIDFESAEFSDKFHVSGSDKRFTYDIVHPRTMEFLLATRGPTLAISQGHVLVTEGGTWRPEQFPRYVDWMTEFFEHWPQHVLADLRSRA